MIKYTWSVVISEKKTTHIIIVTPCFSNSELFFTFQMLAVTAQPMMSKQIAAPASPLDDQGKTQY